MLWYVDATLLMAVGCDISPQPPLQISKKGLSSSHFLCGMQGLNVEFLSADLKFAHVGQVSPGFLDVYPLSSPFPVPRFPIV